MVGLLCGCVKSLRSQRVKPDPGIYLSLLYLVKKQSDYHEYFTASDFVLNSFCSLLRRIDVKESFKAKGNATVRYAQQLCVSF